MIALDQVLNLTQDKQILFLQELFTLFATEELLPLLKTMDTQQLRWLIIFLLCGDESKRQSLIEQANTEIHGLAQVIHTLASKTALLSLQVQEYAETTNDNSEKLLEQL